LKDLEDNIPLVRPEVFSTRVKASEVDALFPSERARREIIAAMVVPTTTNVSKHCGKDVLKGLTSNEDIKQIQRSKESCASRAYECMRYQNGHENSKRCSSG
jgi:hypothetical protein